MKYTDELATSTSTATTETACTGSPYSPLTNGRLTKVEVAFAGTAATSLLEGGYVKLSCPLWGVDMYVPFTGHGLRTVPVGAAVEIASKECDLPLKTGVPVTIVILHKVTPVTPIMHIYGDIVA